MAKSFLKYSLIFIFLTLFVGCQQSRSPLSAQTQENKSSDWFEGSPYPISATPDTLYVVDEARFTPDQRLTIESLQGVLAQTKPAIYRYLTGGYARWLADLETNYGVTLNRTYQGDFVGLLRHFKSRISGYFLCDRNTISANVALSLCGLRQALAATPALQPVLDSLKIPLLQDVRTETFNELLDAYGARFATRAVVFQKPEKSLNLNDYAVFGKMLTFFADVPGPLFTRVLNRSPVGGALLGWGNDEFKLVSESSRHGFWVHAADWSLNLSTLTNFSADLKQKTVADTAFVSRENVHTVCFLMTDGDNIQWLLNDFATNPQWYGSPLRGQLPLGWTVSPAMSQLAPTVLSLFYREAAASEKGHDYFVASSSGLGYMYPERFKNLPQFAALTAKFMEKSDLHILNIIGNERSEASLVPFLRQRAIDAIFYYDFANYSGGKGAIDWMEGKPVICGRYNLWQGFETPASLAEKLNHLPRDARSPQGYSLIPVHVWSNGVPQIQDCIQRLNTNVLVVTPDVFVKRIVHFLASPCGP